MVNAIRCWATRLGSSRFVGLFRPDAFEGSIDDHDSNVDPAEERKA